ncbi:MAG: hypothetical protein KAS15_05355 [Nanoarchaeota archaeon]|nr:hypothetical protein [Nanoarchaeota archaeon]
MNTILTKSLFAAKEFIRMISKILNKAITLILLFIVYFIGIGLTSIIAKIFNKHFLNVRNKNKISYYTKIARKKQPEEYHYRQF